jgi:hypothetical protein
VWGASRLCRERRLNARTTWYARARPRCRNPGKKASFLIRGSPAHEARSERLPDLLSKSLGLRPRHRLFGQSAAGAI